MPTDARRRHRLYRWLSDGRHHRRRPDANTTNANRERRTHGARAFAARVGAPTFRRPRSTGRERTLSSPSGRARRRHGALAIPQACPRSRYRPVACRDLRPLLRGLAVEWAQQLRAGVAIHNEVSPVPSIPRAACSFSASSMKGSVPFGDEGSPTQQLVDTPPRPRMHAVGSRGVAGLAAGFVSPSRQQEIALPQLERDGHLGFDAFGRVCVRAADEHDEIRLADPIYRVARPLAVDGCGQEAVYYPVRRVTVSLRHETATEFGIVSKSKLT